jgi:hypothetical protein
MTVEEARKNRVCRICGEPLPVPVAPRDWTIAFGEMVYPVAITLEFGDEFAHTACLPPEARYGAQES